MLGAVLLSPLLGCFLASPSNLKVHKIFCNMLGKKILYVVLSVLEVNQENMPNDVNNILFLCRGKIE